MWFHSSIYIHRRWDSKLIQINFYSIKINYYLFVIQILFPCSLRKVKYFSIRKKAIFFNRNLIYRLLYTIAFSSSFDKIIVRLSYVIKLFLWPPRETHIRSWNFTLRKVSEIFMSEKQYIILSPHPLK